MNKKILILSMSLQFKNQSKNTMIRYEYTLYDIIYYYYIVLIFLRFLVF